MEEKLKKQKRLSVGLRIVSVLAGLAAFAFCIIRGISNAIPYLTTDEVWKFFGDESHQEIISYETYSAFMHGHLIFAFLTGILVYYILIVFQRVCMEIGKDNSFSVENVKNFSHMAWASVAAAVLYGIRVVIYVFRFAGAGYTRVADILAWGYTICLVIFLLFAYLCRSLAKLIFNAYEVQSENDLTI